MKRRYIFGLLLIGVVLAAGCAGPPMDAGAETGGSRTPVPQAREADDFVVVDCLLPGQVRKLGRMTYMTPRRPVKATALECEIRGGEYVAYDRGSYEASLAVWRPQAETGDKIAQTYMGEIYLRGIGGSPRHEKAAKWFRMAAEQGHTRAQINLGYLYENGLGVPRDRQAALSWYRKATGDEIAALAAGTGRPAIDPAERLELERLRQEVERRRSENAAMRQQLEGAREELDRLRRELEERNRRIDAEKEALENARAELARKSVSRSAADASAERLSSQLNRREAELRRQRAQLDRLQERVAGLKTASAEREAALSELDRMKRDLEGRRAEAAALRHELAKTRREMAEKEAAATADRDRETAELETALARREAELQKERQAAERLKTKIARLDREREAYQKRLSRTRETGETAGDGPVIEVIDPKPLASRGIRVVSVQKEAKGRQVVGRVSAPAGLYSFTVNGASQTPDTNGLFKVWVSMAPAETTPVSIVAVDKRGKRTDLSFVITPEEGEGRAGGPERGRKSPEFSFGTYHALIIGNNDYQHLPRLETAVNDARTLADILKNRYGFKTTLLLNASRYEIYTALDALRKKVTEKENFLLYYAGHGELDKNNRRGYWLPVDATPDSYVNAIPNYTITDILNNMSAKQALVIADTCYSGILTRSVVADKGGGMSEEKRLEWLKTLADSRSRTVLSSGGLKPVLDIGGGDHSVFAGALIDILSDNDSVLEASDLHKKVGVLVSYASAELGLQQVPQYAASIHAGHESGDFLFVPKDFRPRFQVSSR